MKLGNVVVIISECPFVANPNTFEFLCGRSLQNMWEKLFTLSLFAQLGLRSIIPGSGFTTHFVNFSLFMLERHVQWIKSSNLVDISVTFPRGLPDFFHFYGIV